MNARNYRTNLRLSPLDFPAITGLGESSVAWQSEPHINKENLLLTISKKYILSEMNNKQHEILAVTSDYEIPYKLIKTREDLYEFYIDATLSLNEAYQYVRAQMPALPIITFPVQPLESYRREIDRVFHLLNSQN